MAQPATRSAEAPKPFTAAAVHPADEKLPAARSVPAALQRIAATYAGVVVTPPLAIGQAVGLDTAGTTRLIAAGLLIAGPATLRRTVGIGTFAGNRLPFVNAASYAGFPARAQAVLGSAISAGALVAVVLNLFFHHLGTHSRPAVALKSP